jgi:hypothetical protein
MFTHKSLPWLLEEDNPTVRYLALKDLVDADKTSVEFKKAHEQYVKNGYIPEILNKMNPEGFWEKAGGGYGPKYKSAVWSLITLAQLGANINDNPRIKKACDYYLEHAYSEEHITYNGRPHGVFDCLQGNMCSALLDLGVEDERLDKAFQWMADSQVGETEDGNKIKYYAYKCGPNFSCGANGKKQCSWGAVKVVLALSKLDESKRTGNIQKAINLGVDFLFSVDPFSGNYPRQTDTAPNKGWWKFGFPVFYITDLLQCAEALINLGYGNDPRLKKSTEYILSKQNSEGQWNLEYNYSGKIWSNFGRKGKPNKLVTYRALKVLKSLSQD